MSSTLVLVRHGETPWSEAGKHTGITDVPLSERGVRCAKAIGPILEKFKPFNVFCSPLKRAYETCIYSGINKYQLLDDLTEWNYGDYEGLTTDEIRKLNPNWLLWRDGCPGGEKPDDVSHRADRLLALVHNIETPVVFFAHGHILRVVIARWLGLDAFWGSAFKFKTAAICVLGYEHEYRTIDEFNIRPNLF